MKELKEIILEKLKIYKNNLKYTYDTVNWDRDLLEHMLTFIILDDGITDKFFDNNTGSKISENYFGFYPEDEDGNEIEFYGLSKYTNSKVIRDIPYETEDIEDLFGTIDYNDTVNLYYYFNDNTVKSIIYEAQLDGSWYYSIFGDKDINKIMDLFPDNLVLVEDDARTLLQAYEMNNE